MVRLEELRAERRGVGGLLRVHDESLLKNKHDLLLCAEGHHRRHHAVEELPSEGLRALRVELVCLHSHHPSDEIPQIDRKSDFVVHYEKLGTLVKTVGGLPSSGLVESQSNATILFV